MRILILEDCPVRHRAFKRKLIGNIVVIVETVADALEKLQNEEWDVLFLDHDLDGEANLPSEPGTGWEVAKWISENLDRKPPKVIVHSYNDSGRRKMVDLIPGAIDFPGWWDDNRGRWYYGDGDPARSSDGPEGCLAD